LINWTNWDKVSSIIKPLKEDIGFEDSELMTIVLFAIEIIKSSDSILLIIHTMRRRSKEPCTNWVEYKFMIKVYPLIIHSCKGFNGSK
jgi:hypothetical protein